ncbi:sulfurtransferase-like selenium metabolism protein YedF [Mediterraneibacter catenae]|uniref:Sulfurtransferase-like selenium metabolism protein YedF n=1 Tax=Mediterraneibacter catenae TaxID=2594882 RepID=A0A5M9I2B4_9FIRM|nr:MULTISPECIES: sulfurtransferase-like selenium metabolism protein YedF [Mediterraneibacter]KAA8501445.1 sulfurtransferase-like selenium metabolism protein YedF [Mediterraneibacter catenae]MCF2568541.1 sulfurtransferase-like selenium metabolism protein YedF [Mediterraneibacter glycyrrhizinilyticus]MDN0043574.1 sulfurtransferase-like selenium metabolism protein YedF [Mediterraneibacter glycyrrhizinilyticus]
MITVNAMGDICPIPVVKTKKALGELNGPGEIEVLVDNETAVKNVTKMARSSGAEAESEQLGDKQYRVLITVGEDAAEKLKSAKSPAVQPQGQTQQEAAAGCRTCVGTVVAVGSDRMGEGSEELGHILIKSFIFALTQLDDLPDKILFYNGGAKLTVEGSESLEDLRTLEEQGVEIMTCGTCLDYYGIKDKLAIGGVTNMYSIVETLQSAMSVIRP